MISLFLLFSLFLLLRLNLNILYNSDIKYNIINIKSSYNIYLINVYF